MKSISKASTGPPPIAVDCDLLDFSSVREACHTVRRLTNDGDDGNGNGNGGIDVLCCNAGIMLQPDQASVDGYDITASTNVLSHFLITKELFGGLEKKASNSSGGARIVTMSSGSGYGAPSFDKRFFERRGGALGDDGRASYGRYHQSKLANLAFTSALDRRLRARKSHVMAVACTPGVCGTDMYIHATSVMSRDGVSSPRDSVPSTEDGCLAQLKCVFDSTVESGDLWGPKRMGEGGVARTEIGPPMILVEKSTEDALWEVCEEAVGSFEL